MIYVIRRLPCGKMHYRIRNGTGVPLASVQQWIMKANIGGSGNKREQTEIYARGKGARRS